MRKLYALLAGLFLSLASCVPAYSQVPEENPSVCRADFERIATAGTNNPLIVSFRALPWHVNNNRIVRICWTFGDGTDTCIQYSNTYTGPYTVQHLYAAPGNYEVCVRIFYAEGCDARKCKLVTVVGLNNCRADFERLPLTTTNNPLHAVFKALPWHVNNKKPVRICWTFGDGSDTCINYPASYTGQYTVGHRYNQPGNYEVCVRIIYSDGCDARKCKPVTIIAHDSCRADFERLPLSTTNNPLQAVFKALPWHNNNKKPLRICWTFGDGTDTCITYPENYTGQYTVSHRYNHPGNYEVCVKIIYYGGCEARKCKPVTINTEHLCRADFERLPQTSTNNPLHAFFKAIPWHHNNRKPARICWTFGDGTDTCINYPENYTGQYTVGHRYNHPGNYEVCVKIFYYGGCEARKCKPVVIQPEVVRCEVQLHEIAPSPTSPERSFFAVPSSTPNRRVERICWYFGDGRDTCITFPTSPTPPQLFIRHVYPGPGVYRACVKIFFQGGCIAMDCKEVVVRSSSNVCGGFMMDSLMGPRTFRFRGFAIHPPNDEVVSWRWTFGDGTSATGREVTHTYSQPGEYEVCLVIRTRRGCETRICKPLRVPAVNHPVLQLSPNPVINELHVQFYSSHTETVVVRITNSNGTVVRTYTRNVTAGANTWGLNVGSLFPGMYLFTIQSPNQFASALFLKI